MAPPPGGITNGCAHCQCAPRSRPERPSPYSIVIALSSANVHSRVLTIKEVMWSNCSGHSFARISPYTFAIPYCTQSPMRPTSVETQLGHNANTVQCALGFAQSSTPPLPPSNFSRQRHHHSGKNPKDTTVFVQVKSEYKCACSQAHCNIPQTLQAKKILIKW